MPVKLSMRSGPTTAEHELELAPGEQPGPSVGLWKRPAFQGERCIVAPACTTDEAKEKYQNFKIEDLPSGKPYLRSVDCPPLKA